MRTYFDEETDKKLLAAKSKEEVMAIIAETPAAAALADKADLVMEELDKIKNGTDEEVDIDELDNVAGGAKLLRIDLSPTQDCVGTFYLADMASPYHTYCMMNDYCLNILEYDYHYTKYSSCKHGGKHEWKQIGITAEDGSMTRGYQCTKCLFSVEADKYHFED